MTVKNRPGDPNIVYRYDISGRLYDVNDIRDVNEGGGITDYYYDRIGRVNDVQDPEGRWVSYDYDSRGLRTTLIYPDDTNVTYEYDTLARLRRIKYEGSLVAEYEYDELSRRRLLTLGNDANAVYEYDLNNRLTKLTNNIDDTNTVTFEYADYDNVGNRLSMKVDDANAHVYTYDVIYQLVFVDYNDGNSTDYFHDSLGNRTDVNESGSITSYSRNELNQYTSVGGEDYDYDDNGNLIDVNTGEYEFAYDCENRLIAANSPDANVTFEYDYLRRRVKKAVEGGATNKYCYDGDQVIAEYDGSDNLLRKFIYGPGIDEPIFMIDVADNNAIYYYHFDGLGSVVVLSNNSGEIVERYSYDVFGEPNRTSDVNNPYLFTGRRYDSETGLYYYRARYYSPKIGRFLQTDPIGYADRMNVYTYVGNNPLEWVDPYGLDKDEREQKIRQLQEYIRSAEAAAIANIETLEILHGKKKFWEDYYDVVQYTDALFTFATAIPAAVRVAGGFGAMQASKVAIKGKPLMGRGVDYTKRLAGERALLKGADSLTDSAVIGTIVGYWALTEINAARRRKMGFYDPYIQDTLDNIAALSKGVKEARRELRILGHDY